MTSNHLKQIGIGLPHVASRLLNTPLMIEPGKLDAIVSGLSERLHVQLDGPSAAVTNREATAAMSDYQPQAVAVIDVIGALAHRTGLDAESTPLLGYETIQATIQTALDDEAVAGIVLNIDSPGGEVDGAFELAEFIYQSTAHKPIVAFVNSNAYSAAYLIASACTRLYCTPMGAVGSIGVVSRHVDVSGQLEQDGVKVTLVHAGARKVDGNPYEPLPDDAKNRLQSRVDYIYHEFVANVAQYRGLTEEAVYATEADIYAGPAALVPGLVDGMGTFDAVLIHVMKLADNFRDREVITMSTDNTAPAAADAQADRLAARESERDRISQILGSEHREGREALAHYLAFETEMDSAQALKILSLAPNAAASQPASFATAMAAVPNPAVGADDGVDSDDQDMIAKQIAQFSNNTRVA